MADGPNWVDLLSHGAAFLDRTYGLMQNYTRADSANKPEASIPASARPARTLDRERLYSALSTGHRILDALEGKPEPKRTSFFW